MDRPSRKLDTVDSEIDLLRKEVKDAYGMAYICYMDYRENLGDPPTAARLWRETARRKAKWERLQSKLEKLEKKEKKHGTH